MIKFVYFDVGGTLMKDFSGSENDKHNLEICRNKFPIEFSAVCEIAEKFKKNESIWPIVQEVSKHCRTGLLTNMYPGMFEIIKQKSLLPKIDWEIIVDSSIEGFAKPDIEIFEIAQKKAGVNNEEILFIDNNSENVKVAKNFGWKTFWYDSKDYELSSKNLLEYINHEFTE